MTPVALATDRGTKVMGRPRKFTPRLATVICQRIMLGESVTKICESPGMPNRNSIVRWLASSDPMYREFHEQYRRARIVQAEMKIDEIFDIADDSRNDWIPTYNKKGEQNGWKPDNEAIQRARLRIDTRKWFAGKMAPKIYGDHLEIQHDVTGDLADLMRDASNKTTGLPKPIDAEVIEE